jgi:hypothetical protein
LTIINTSRATSLGSLRKENPASKEASFVFHNKLTEMQSKLQSNSKVVMDLFPKTDTFTGIRISLSSSIIVRKGTLVLMVQRTKRRAN